MATAERKAELIRNFSAKIEEVNAACSKGTSAELEGKLAELTNIEKEYRTILEKEVFGSLDNAHEAIVKHHFKTISHKKITDEGRMTGVEKSDKMVQIDLKKFCEYKGLDLDWYYELQALNKRLTLRVAESIGVGAAEMKKIDDSYAMDRLASDIELGKTPTSDTQVVKHMQKVLDTLSPDEGRINKYDLGYVMACYTKRNNRVALRVQCSKHTMLMSLMGDVFYRIATGGVYGADYKQKAVTEVEPENAAPKAKAPKAQATKIPEPEKVSDSNPIPTSEGNAAA